MISKRPCVILVADSNMAAAFRGYFQRDGWHFSLGCAPFEIDTGVVADLIVDEGGNDPGEIVLIEPVVLDIIDAEKLMTR